MTKIGLRLECLELPFRRALAEAERLGVGGVQFDAVGELSPETLSQTGRRQIRHLLRTHNLEMTALGCPLRHGLDEAANLDARLEHVRKVLSLSFELDARIAIVQAGRIEADAKADAPGNRLLTESLLTLGQYGDRVGATLCLETGLEAPDALQTFLDRFDTGGLGVNLDPANLLLNGFDPCAAIPTLGQRIKHVHARDARKGRSSTEVPLGHGSIDWLLLLARLTEIEYRGWLVLNREEGQSRRADMASGVTFLRRLGS